MSVLSDQIKTETKTKTLRTVLLGSVTEFAESCDLQGLTSASNLAALVVSLSNYHEEGENLLPELYLCNDTYQVIKMLPGYDLRKH